MIHCHPIRARAASLQKYSDRLKESTVFSIFHLFSAAIRFPHIKMYELSAINIMILLLKNGLSESDGTVAIVSYHQTYNILIGMLFNLLKLFPQSVFRILFDIVRLYLCLGSNTNRPRIYTNDEDACPSYMVFYENFFFHFICASYF